MFLKKFTLIVFLLSLIFSLSSSLVYADPIADPIINTETTNLSLFDDVSCFSEDSRAFHNINPVIGTKTDCELIVYNTNPEYEKLLSSSIRMRIGSAPQSPLCDKPESATSGHLVCKNIPISGRPGFQTIKINGKVVGKIKVESSVPSLTLESIANMDDKKDLNDPNHTYQIQFSTKNFVSNENGYKIIAFPKNLKNPLKSKIILEDDIPHTIPASYTKSQLLGNSDQVCVIVARNNKLLAKTKICQSLPNQTNKQITSEVFSNALNCPESIEISKGETSLKCSFSLPEGSVQFDPNYYGTSESLFFENYKTSGISIGTSKILDGKEYLDKNLGSCKVVDNQLMCDIDPAKIKETNLTLPTKIVIGVAFVPFGGDLGMDKIVKSVQLK